jgi:hypothetical protein
LESYRIFFFDDALNLNLMWTFIEPKQLTPNAASMRSVGRKDRQGAGVEMRLERSRKEEEWKERIGVGRAHGKRRGIG